MPCRPSMPICCAVCAATFASAKSSMSRTGPFPSTCRASSSSEIRANLVLCQLYQHLAGIGTAEQPDQRRRCLFDALHDRGAVMYASFREPTLHVGEKLCA